LSEGTTQLYTAYLNRYIVTPAELTLLHMEFQAGASAQGLDKLADALAREPNAILAKQLSESAERVRQSLLKTPDSQTAVDQLACLARKCRTVLTNTWPNNQSKQSALAACISSTLTEALLKEKGARGSSLHFRTTPWAYFRWPFENFRSELAVVPEVDVSLRAAARAIALARTVESSAGILHGFCRHYVTFDRVADYREYFVGPYDASRLAVLTAQGPAAVRAFCRNKFNDAVFSDAVANQVMAELQSQVVQVVEATWNEFRARSDAIVRNGKTPFDVALPVPMTDPPVAFGKAELVSSLIDGVSYGLDAVGAALIIGGLVGAPETAGASLVVTVAGIVVSTVSFGKDALMPAVTHCEAAKLQNQFQNSISITFLYGAGQKLGFLQSAMSGIDRQFKLQNNPEQL
jgi:hypothetical protein